MVWGDLAVKMSSGCLNAQQQCAWNKENREPRWAPHISALSPRLLRSWDDIQGFVFFGGGGFTRTLEKETYFFLNFFDMQSHCNQN